MVNQTSVLVPLKFYCIIISLKCCLSPSWHDAHTQLRKPFLAKMLLSFCTAPLMVLYLTSCGIYKAHTLVVWRVKTFYLYFPNTAEVLPCICLVSYFLLLFPDNFAYGDQKKHQKYQLDAWAHILLGWSLMIMGYGRSVLQYAHLLSLVIISVAITRTYARYGWKTGNYGYSLF